MNDPKESITENELKALNVEVALLHLQDCNTLRALLIINDMIATLGKLLKSDGILYSPAVADVVLTAMENSAQSDGQTDVLKGTRILIAAAMRFSQASVTGMQTKVDPASTKDPDEPITI